MQDDNERAMELGRDFLQWPDADDDAGVVAYAFAYSLGITLRKIAETKGGTSWVVDNLEKLKQVAFGAPASEGVPRVKV